MRHCVRFFTTLSALVFVIEVLFERSSYQDLIVTPKEIENMHLQGPMTMTHKRLRSGSSLLAAALTGAVAPAQATAKEPNMGDITLALAREIAVDTDGAKGSRGLPSGALVGRAGR